MSAFLYCWLLTLGIEIPIILALKHKNNRWHQLLLPAFCASTLTLPWLWFVLPYWLGHSALLTWGEAMVILVETLLLASWLKIYWVKVLLITTLANLASLLLGNAIINRSHGIINF